MGNYWLKKETTPWFTDGRSLWKEQFGNNSMFQNKLAWASGRGIQVDI